MTTLFVSPHFDDVALSCAAGLLERVREGQRVVVATVFGGGNAARQYEDAAALTAAGAEHRNLDFSDAPERRGLPLSFRALMLDAEVLDDETRQVADALALAIAELRPRQVWWPLGVGGHVDHRTVFAASRLLNAPGRYYEDRPYAFVPALRELRRLQLEGGVGRVALAAEDVDRQLQAGGCGTMLTESERAYCTRELAARMSRSHPGQGLRLTHETRVYGETPGEAVALINAYRSQVRWLFGNGGVGPLWARHALTPDGEMFERTYSMQTASSPE